MLELVLKYLTDLPPDRCREMQFTISKLFIFALFFDVIIDREVQAVVCGSTKPCSKLPFKPVCAVQKLRPQEETKHVSYDNECYFDVALCWVKASGGTITRKTSCDTVATATAKASKGDELEWRDKRSDQADCPEAESCLVKPYEPVCASDGKTYANYCLFKLQRCTEDKDLKFVYSGKCTYSNDKE